MGEKVNAEKAIEIANKLYECRKAAKQILGADYKSRMTELQQLIKSQCNASQCDELEAVKILIKGSSTGMREILFFSAYVEMIEPS